MPDWDEACNGKYQILTAFLLCCIQLPITFSDHLLHLYGWTPPHRCRLPPQNSTALGHALPWPIVEVKGRKMFASCSMYIDPNDHLAGIQPCSYGWEYLHSEEEWTLITEWDLVCEREYLMTLLPYVYTVGTMLGGLLFGVLADHYGRRFNLLAALFLHTVLGLSLHFFSLFTIFAVGYSLQGVLVTAIQCISFTLLLETVQYHHHLKATICLCFVTPIGIIILSIISWLIKNWRYIQLAISAPGIVCLGYFWLIPRSLPWLLAEGYTNEAEKQLVHFARFNRAMLPLNFRVRILSFCKKIKSYTTGSQHSLETVVCSTKIRRYTFILYYMWFVISLDSESSSSELPALKNNKYASLFVKGLMDTGVLILVYFFAQRFGPRSAHGTALGVGGLFCIGSVLLGYSTYFSEIKPFIHLLTLLSPILSVIGKACIRSAAATSIFFTLKIFPTGVRAIGLGSCLFWSRTAHLIGIHISSLEVENTYNIPLAVYGFLSIIGGFLTSFLPANCHRPLPNVAIEVEKAIILDDFVRRKRARPLVAPLQRTLSSIDTDVLHFDEEQENERNNTLLELSVREFQNSRLQHVSTCHLRDVAGPSRLCHVTDRSSILDKEDTESRLTDLEDELNRIWEVNPVPEEEANTDSLAEFRHGDVREHYVRMNETRF
ncbi:Solute carrier family 22 member 5 like protein [Argiope bruennichi]|uniref:Solute carrier family 22 member 5 like protein n=1 Tax=Argiope bruennichi TaxID=94029 RepID=A0A8T0EM44_ARGBR|nr:Solute carrier family 22 member 5 like protein [Argiope bruennichi]